MSRTSTFLLILLATASGAQAQKVAPQYSVEDIQKSFGCDTPDGSCAPAAADEPATGEPSARSNVRTGKTRTFSIYNGAPAKSGTSAAPQATSRPRLAAVAPAPKTGAHRNLLITFANASVDLTDQAKANARVFAQALNMPALSTASFAIEGHTNQVGNRDYNVDLSRRRAAALADFLVENGVDRSRLEVRGYGFDQLANPADPRAASNRRVEARRLN